VGACVRCRWSRELCRQPALLIAYCVRLYASTGRRPLLHYISRPIVYESSFDYVLAND